MRDILETNKSNKNLKSFKIADKTVPKYVPEGEGNFCDPYNKKIIKGDKSTTLRTNSSNGNVWIKQTSDKPQQITEEQEVYWRKLTPLECERLQTVPDNYTNHVSKTQRFKMLGNGWTIEVVKHILQGVR